MGRLKLGSRYPRGPRGSRLKTDAPGLAVARQAAGLSVEALAEDAGVSADRVRRLEFGGFGNLIGVSRLQGCLRKLTGIDIREET